MFRPRGKEGSQHLAGYSDSFVVQMPLALDNKKEATSSDTAFYLHSNTL